MGQIEEIAFEEETPVIKERVEKYWTKRSESFGDLREAEIHSNKYERWEAEILSQFSDERQRKIIDVGCGCGFFEIMLAKNGHQVTGIDLTPSMIEKGKELVEKHGCQANLQVMDAENLEFSDEIFDVVISRNLTWTLPHPLKAYEEWKRVLKPGGMILIYDAEYAKNFHDMIDKNRADSNIGDEMRNECHNIYHMLTISSKNRPEWDVEQFQRIGMSHTECEKNVGANIYIEQDEFYIPDPIFRIKAIK